MSDSYSLLITFLHLLAAEVLSLLFQSQLQKVRPLVVRFQ